MHSINQQGFSLFLRDDETQNTYSKLDIIANTVIIKSKVQLFSQCLIVTSLQRLNRGSYTYEWPCGLGKMAKMCGWTSFTQRVKYAKQYCSNNKSYILFTGIM